jgi:hypothetical protein
MGGGRRIFIRHVGSAACALALGGCAHMGRESVRVNVVAFEPLPGEGMEARMAVKLRLQNPTDVALDYDGISIELDVGGATFASGVSDERGSVARFGEAVVAVPVSISAMAVLRQVLALARGRSTRVEYALRGRLANAGTGGTRFASTGEIEGLEDLGL